MAGKHQRRAGEPGETGGKGGAAMRCAPGRRSRVDVLVPWLVCARAPAAACAAGDDNMDKAKAAAQRAEAGLSGSFLDDETPKKGALDDSKLQALLQKKSDAPAPSSAEAADKAKERMETFEAQLKEVRDRKQTGKSKEELDVRGVRIGASTGEETEWDEARCSTHEHTHARTHARTNTHTHTHTRTHIHTHTRTHTAGKRPRRATS